MRACAPPPRGFTLPELMIGLAIASILAVAAVPSFAEMAARMRLEGAMSALGTDLQYTRSEALRRRAAVRLATTADGGGYTISTGAGADLVVLKNVALTNGLGLTNSVTVTYDPMRAFANAAELTGGAVGTTATLRSVVNTVGRVQTCTPSGSFKGYPTC